MSGVDSSFGDASLLSYPPLPPPSLDIPSGATPTLLESSSQPADSSVGYRHTSTGLENDQQLLIDLGAPTLANTYTIGQSLSNRPPDNTEYASFMPNPSVAGGSQQPLVSTSTDQSTYRTIAPSGSQASSPPLNTIHSQHLALHSLRGTQPPRLQEATQVTDSSSTSSLRVHHLEQLCGKLQTENKTLQDNFGRQRKKFMDKMLEMEAERMLLSNTIDRYSKEVREISTELLTRDEELKNMSMALKLSEAHMREDFDADRVKYEEEIASLGQILSVQSQEQSAALSAEREAWKRERGGLLLEIHHLKQPRDDDDAPSTRPVHVATDTLVKSGETTPTRQLDSPSPEGDDLEFDMAKAAQDTRLLRSVVVPLEEEIDLLKMKLKETQERLTYYESHDSAHQTRPTPTPPLINFDLSPTTTSVTGLTSPTESEKVTQLQHQLKLERTAHRDLEMHIEALMTQKTTSHQEIITLTQELEKLKDGYEMERNQHNALKQTWELANQHFLVAQNRLEQQVYTVKEQLARKNAESPMSEGKASPTVTGDGVGGDPGEGVRKYLTIPRAHRRSQSSEGGDTVLPGLLQKQRSSSLPSINKDTAAAMSRVGDAVDFQQRMASLEEENTVLQDELTRQKAMCDGYEKQLHRVQEQMVVEMDDKERDMDRLRAEMDKCKTGIMRERETQKKLRREVSQQMEQIRAKVDTYRETEKRLKQELRMHKDKFTELKHDTQTEIARLTEERMELRKQLEAAREEYDCLKVLQAQQMTDYQETISSEREARNEAELNVQTTMSQLLAVQSRLQSTEEDLCTHLALVKEQLIQETQQKEKMMSSLTTQLESSMRENAGLQSLKADIEAERRAKEEAMMRKASIQEKSTTFIQDQQKQIELLHEEKEACERQVVDLQRQLSSLKHQLNRTAETQKDFVELSQSLQMRLVEMEESQKSNSSETSPT